MIKFLYNKWINKACPHPCFLCEFKPYKGWCKKEIGNYPDIFPIQSVISCKDWNNIKKSIWHE